MEGKARILVYGFSAEEQRRIDEGLASLGVPPALKARPEQGGGLSADPGRGAWRQRRKPRWSKAAEAALVPFHNIRIPCGRCWAFP
jgi:hypothetical protein